MPALIDAAIDGISGDVPANVALAIAITDIGRVTMVLGALLEKWINKRRERQMNEAISEAVAETTAARAGIHIRPCLRACLINRKSTQWRKGAKKRF